MTRTSDLPFAKLRQLLLDLDFPETVGPTGPLTFKHNASDTVFLSRLYQPDDRVSTIDLLSTRKHLDERGLLSAQSFDARLRKASA
jgi:hypothetical protein